MTSEWSAPPNGALQITANRKISRRSGWHRVNRAKSWTFQRFRAAMDLGAVTGGSSS